MHFYKRSVVYISAIAASVLLPAQVPLLLDEVASFEATDQVRLDWQLQAARRAQAVGLSGLAESIYRNALRRSTSLGVATLSEIYLELSKALIAQERFFASKEQLEQIPELQRNAQFYLQMAISIYGRGGDAFDEAAFADAAAQIDPLLLSADLRPWLSFLEGLAAESRGDFEGSREAYRRAAEEATGDAQRLHFEGMALRQEILSGSADESLAVDLAARMRSLEGRSAAYPYIREYVVLLNRLGRGREGIEVIDRELANTSGGIGGNERDQLRLLKALILGPDTEEGRGVLRELIQTGQNRDAMGIALQMLARMSGADADLFEFLKVMISRTERHPLLGQMYFLRSQLALSFSNDPEMAAIAERDARTLLEQFPGLSSITSVYRLLAYGALTREPPQYRAAADFLIQLRDQTEDPQELFGLNSLIGDSYFLNGDFANAVDFYMAARNRRMGMESEASVLMRLVFALIQSGSLDTALALIDEADFSGELSLRDRWRAEWNIAQALQAGGSIEEALRRVRMLLERTIEGPLETILDIRLRWLEARLSLQAAEFEGLGGRLDDLLSRLDSFPEIELGEANMRLLRTETRLLRGEFWIHSGSAPEGLDELKVLRENFGESAAAQRSYLVEAAYHGSVEALVEAQETLTAFVERYPDSVLAPQALFESALYSERRGPDFYTEAIVLHNQLAERYPGDALYYRSRLKQGNLLRSLNDFAGAQIVYENLINRYPSHELRYLAELSRADCLLALAGNQPEELVDAITQLERLLDLPRLPLDFQAEASFKWGFALQKSGATNRAKDIFSLAIGRFLPDPEAVEGLGPSGRYWLARSMLSLGELLEAEGAYVEARRIYRTMIAYKFPGEQIALNRASQLVEVD